MNNRIEYVKTVPLLTRVPDNFAPGLHSFVARKTSTGVYLQAAPAYERFVFYWQLDIMLYGV